MKAVPKLDKSESGLIMVLKKWTEPILMPELQNVADMTDICNIYVKHCPVRVKSLGAPTN